MLCRVGQNDCRDGCCIVISGTCRRVPVSAGQGRDRVRQPWPDTSSDNPVRVKQKDVDSTCLRAVETRSRAGALNDVKRLAARPARRARIDGRLTGHVLGSQARAQSRVDAGNACVWAPKAKLYGAPPSSRRINLQAFKVLLEDPFFCFPLACLGRPNRKPTSTEPGSRPLHGRYAG